jgi:UDP-N-acetylglucosamine 2-epimerase (hydrolysing)
MRIGILTGKRGGFDAMLPLIKKLEKTDWADLLVIVCDQHMMPLFGGTHKYVREKLDSETRIAYVTATAGNSRELRSYNCSKVMKDIAELCVDLDTLILYGDRGESLAAAQAALIQGVRIVQLEAGEMTGTIDDPTRMAITCLADYVFVPHLAALERTKSLTYTTVSGDLHLDAYKDVATSIEAIAWVKATKKDLYIAPKDRQTAIFLMHPMIEDYGDYTRLDTGTSAHKVISTLVNHNYRILAIYPCSDPGYEPIIEVIHTFEKRGEVMAFQNIPGRIFRRLLTDADLMVGNSSAGIKEAPFVKTISIDIGTRQKGRDRDCGVFPVKTHDIDPILTWLSKHELLSYDPWGTGPRAVLGKRTFPYGDGNATDIVFTGLERIIKEGDYNGVD